MTQRLNIIILAGIKTEEAYKAGDFPYYLCEADGIPLIQAIIKKCAALNPEKIICMLPTAEVEKYHLRNMISQIHPAAVAHSVHETTMGAACTALLASERIDNDGELIIVSANELLDEPLNNILNAFRNENRDAGVVIFKSLHPRYAFVRINSTGNIIEASEKNPISPHAVASLYWFKSGIMFVEAVKNMIRKDAKVNNSFYIAPALNELILQHKNIGTYRVDPSQYHPLKNAAQMHAYEAQGGRT